MASTPQSLTAANTVWNVEELLENILLHLPLRDLLTSRCVCRTWRKGTPRIRQSLFLQPRPGRCTYHDIDDKPGWKDLDGNSVTSIYNPFISDKFIFIPDGAESNEMLASLPYGGEIIHYGLVAPEPTIDENQLTYQEAAFLGMGASWRNMLVMQPPATQIEFGCENHFYDVTGQSYIAVTNPDGVACGEVIDAYRDHWMQCPTCPIWGTPDLDGPARWQVHGGRDLRVMELGTGYDSWWGMKDASIDVAAAARSKDEEGDEQESEKEHDEEEEEIE